MPQITAKKNSDRGFPNRRPTAFLLHIVSFVADRGHGVPNDQQVSHLCDRRNCFNPNHLLAESVQANNSRKGCPGPLFCPDHGHKIASLCKHAPTKCIRPPNPDVICCLSIKHSHPDFGRATESLAPSTPDRPTPRHVSEQVGAAPTGLAAAIEQATEIPDSEEEGW